MEKAEVKLLSLLGEYLFDAPETDISEAEAERALEISVKHNIFSLCFGALSKKEKAAGIVGGRRAEFLTLTALEIRKTQAFRRFALELSKSGLPFLVVKGAAVRALYPEPELRSSADEDLLIKPEDMNRFLGLALENGFELKSRGENELAVFQKNSGLLVEAQSLLFTAEDFISQKMNRFFSEPFSNAVSVSAGGSRFLTLDYSENLLYLFCHAFKHFIRSGFGIRQVLDILLFCREYKDKIDFSFVFSCLEKIGAEGFAADILSVGRDYFSLSIGFSYEKYETAAERLLSDIFSAGVFGRSSASRAHSAGITLSAVTDGVGAKTGALSRVFIKKEKLAKVYPGLEKRGGLYLWYSCKRLFGYFRESSKPLEAKEAVDTARNRLGLFDMYSFMRQKNAAAEFDRLQIEAIEKKIASGEKVRLAVTGRSMLPFLRENRDFVLLEKPKKPLRPGDVALYERNGGAYVLHRIVKINREGLFFSGDAQSFTEGPVKSERIIAVCFAFERDGKPIKRDNIFWRFYPFALHAKRKLKSLFAPKKQL